ncbi:MAG TPA: FHA domain-containing protein, partial [Myxococcaceae bacterium]|nr:FHA domain-containing protein [Myxococcaceae bacterium]
MAAGKKNGVMLRITGPDGSVHEAISEADSIIVGSGAQAAVKILDPRVSNLHVMLKVENTGTVTAIDLGSESGTQVGGQRVVGPRTLSPGDVLVVGSSRVEVVFGMEEAPPPTAVGAEVSGATIQGSVLHRPVEPSHRTPEIIVPPGLRARAAVKNAQRRTPTHLQEPLPAEALPTKE